MNTERRTRVFREVDQQADDTEGAAQGQAACGCRRPVRTLGGEVTLELGSEIRVPLLPLVPTPSLRLPTRHALIPVS